MEHIPGIALKDVWSQMTKLQHIDFIERMGALVKELCALDFGAFGSLYLKVQNHAQRCKQVWAIMVFICPKLGKATTLNPAVCRYLTGVSSGSSDDATALRSLLTDVSRKWSVLGLPGDCPYQPSQADAELLSIELEELESTERLQAYLSRLLRCETNGWVEKERWDEVLPVYREQYAEFVNSCIASREEDETVEDVKMKADRLWPYDLR